MDRQLQEATRDLEGFHRAECAEYGHSFSEMQSGHQTCSRCGLTR